MTRLVIIAAALAATTAVRASADDYAVTLSDRFPRRARVEARLTPDAGTLRFLDNEATGLLHGWSTFIVGLEAQDDDGRPLDLEYEPTGRWVVEGGDGRPVRVRYWMNLQHDGFPLDVGAGLSAYATSSGVLWTGRALFLAGADRDTVTVRFNVPAHWTVVAPWPSDPHDPETFRVGGTADLVNAAFFAGTPRLASATVGDLTVRFALTGDRAAESERVFAAFVTDALEAYRGAFGGAPAATIVFIAGELDAWSGGVLGHTISLTLAEAPGPGNLPVWSRVVAHELMHPWTTALRVDEAERALLEWFFEGLAEYGAMRQAVRRGEIDGAGFCAALAEHFGRYLASYGRVPLSRAGGPAGLPDFVTSGGTIAVVALDILIREATANARSLDDLARRAYARHGPGADGRLDLDALADLLHEIGGRGFADFLDAHVSGTRLVPFQAILRHAGLRVGVEGREAGPPLVEIRAEADPSSSQQAIWHGLTGAP